MAVPRAYIFEALIIVSCDDNRYRDIRLRGQREDLRLCMNAFKRLCGQKTGLHGPSRTLMSAVLALKSLQKFIILSPACPSAGPTGGAGFACPALITSLIVDVTVLAFFDML